MDQAPLIAFFAGLGVFALNFIGIWWMGRVLIFKREKMGKFLGVSLLKMVGTGALVFICLVTFDLPALGFVLGAAVGLGLLALSALLKARNGAF